MKFYGIYFRRPVTRALFALAIITIVNGSKSARKKQKTDLPHLREINRRVRAYKPNSSPTAKISSKEFWCQRSNDQLSDGEVPEGPFLTDNYAFWHSQSKFWTKRLNKFQNDAMRGSRFKRRGSDSVCALKDHVFEVLTGKSKFAFTPHANKALADSVIPLFDKQLRQNEHLKHVHYLQRKYKGRGPWTRKTIGDLYRALDDSIIVDEDGEIWRIPSYSPESSLDDSLRDDLNTRTENRKSTSSDAEPDEFVVALDKLWAADEIDYSRLSPNTSWSDLFADERSATASPRAPDHPNERFSAEPASVSQPMDIEQSAGNSSNLEFVDPCLSEQIDATTEISSLSADNAEKSSLSDNAEHSDQSRGSEQLSSQIGTNQESNPDRVKLMQPDSSDSITDDKSQNSPKTCAVTETLSCVEDIPPTPTERSVNSSIIQEFADVLSAEHLDVKGNVLRRVMIHELLQKDLSKDERALVIKTNKDPEKDTPRLESLLAKYYSSRDLAKIKRNLGRTSLKKKAKSESKKPSVHV